MTPVTVTLPVAPVVVCNYLYSLKARIFVIVFYCGATRLDLSEIY